jgi:hypothetical protein
MIGLPTFEVHNVNIRQIKNELPSIVASMDVIAANYSQITGKRLFINPNILSKYDERLNEDEDRQFNVVLRDEHTDIDSVEIQIPVGYEVESAFQDTKIETKFGTFSAYTRVLPGKIIYFRKQEYFSGTFPAKDYADLKNYFDRIFKTDHTKIVLVKQE